MESSSPTTPVQPSDGGRLDAPRRDPPSDCAQALARNGVAVLRTRLYKSERRREVVEALDREVRGWPELEPGAVGMRAFTDDSTVLVGGSFGALANPSSFHSPMCRQLRLLVYLAVAACRPFDLSGGYQVSQVIDRLAKRPKGQKFPGETWHRDEATGLRPGDRVYGGWINLGDTDQWFSCVPGSHIGVTSTGAGFAKFSDAEKAEFNARRTRVRVPPGCLLIFNELIVHEVVGKTMPTSMIRLFTGWYVSKSGEPHDSRPGDIIDGPEGRISSAKARLLARLSMQMPMPIKSGQAPAYVPGLYWCNSPHLIGPLTEGRLRSAALKGRTRSHTAKSMAGKTIQCPHNRTFGTKYLWTTLPSLKTMNERDPSISMWPPYTELDKAILLPATDRGVTRLAADIKAHLSS